MSNNVSYGISAERPSKRWWQPYKGIFFLFKNVPDPEDIKYAQDDFDETYQACEECNKTLYLCTCMLEIDGFGLATPQSKDEVLK